VRLIRYDFRGSPRLAQRTHQALLQSISVPAGYDVTDPNAGGNTDHSSRGLWLVLAVGIALVLLVIAFVFDSVWAAAVAFAGLPLALAGVMLAFWLTGEPFTREAAVGLILVVGLTVNQTIILVDAAMKVRSRNVKRSGSSALTGPQIIRAASSCFELIVLVTAVALGSFLPLAVATKQRDLFGSIAIAGLGGTLASLVAALFVLPVLLAVVRPRVPRAIAQIMAGAFK